MSEDRSGQRRVVRLGAAALWYAQQGIAVFPITVGGKSPLIPKSQGGHGCKDATTDTDQIRAWWSKHPHANIGLATGLTFDVVDIDGPQGQATRTRYWCSVPGCLEVGADGTCTHELGPFGLIDSDALAKVITPRHGGMHIYVPVTGERNATHKLPGIDYRGAGGYVVAPPSVISPEWAARNADTPGPYVFLGTPLLARG